MQARPHDRIVVDQKGISLDEEAIRNLPWVKEKVAKLNRIGKDLVEFEIGPYAGELWIDRNNCIDVVELVPGTVSACLQLSSTGRRVSEQEIHGSGFVPATVAVARSYAECVSVAISSGVHKEYLGRKVESSRPRGKLDISSTIRGPWSSGRIDHVVTSRRELTEDNSVNRILLLACMEAEWRLEGYPEDLARIRSASTALKGASLDRGIATWPDNHLAPKFNTALGLAREVLGGVAISTSLGQLRNSHSAWVNVERIFEEAIRSLFRQIYVGVVTKGEDEDVQLFHALPDEDGPIFKTANPDIVLRRDGAVVAVLDAKYRRSGDRPSDSEIYQLLAHATAFGAKSAALVTPAIYGEPGIRRLGRAGDGCAVDVISVDSSSVHSMETLAMRWLKSAEVIVSG